MKKLFLLVAIAFASAGANAQGLKGVWDFLGGNQYEILAGFNSSVASEPYDNEKKGFGFGVTARREVASVMEDKIGVYGLVGLILTTRGGKHTDTIYLENLLDSNENFSVGAWSIPIHGGAEYKWNKVSLFADLGPNVLLKRSDADTDNLTTNPVGFGVGFNVGVRFKRFAMSLGYDQDVTDLAKFEPDDEQQKKLNLKKDSYSLKTGEFHFNLRWTLGKIDK